MRFSTFQFVGLIAIALALAIPTDAKESKSNESLNPGEGMQTGSGDKSSNGHRITLVGDGKLYKIKGEKYAKGKKSEANCDGKSKTNKVCTVSTQSHDQIFTIGCSSNQKTNFGRVSFSRSGDVEVSTKGHIWAGFSNDEPGTKLRSSEKSMKALKTKGDDVGVLFNCKDDSRGDEKKEI